MCVINHAFFRNNYDSKKDFNTKNVRQFLSNFSSIISEKWVVTYLKFIFGF